MNFYDFSNNICILIFLLNSSSIFNIKIGIFAHGDVTCKHGITNVWRRCVAPHDNQLVHTWGPIRGLIVSLIVIIYV